MTWPDKWPCVRGRFLPGGAWYGSICGFVGGGDSNSCGCSILVGAVSVAAPFVGASVVDVGVSDCVSHVAVSWPVAQAGSGKGIEAKRRLSQY